MHVSTHLDIDLVAMDQADEVTCLLELTAPESAATQQRPGTRLPAEEHVHWHTSEVFKSEPISVA